jgi:hypothetical protein
LGEQWRSERSVKEKGKEKLREKERGHDVSCPYVESMS